MLEDLRAFVEQETPSTEPRLLRPFASFLCDRACSIADGRGEIVAGSHGGLHVRVEYGRAGSGRPVLLLGHFDTVWPAGTLTGMPFRIENGQAFGPGSFDMKAGLVQGLWAIRALAETNQPVPSIVFFANCDEEIGSKDSRALIEDEARSASGVLVLEPSLDGALKTARKGVARFTIEVVGRAAHAGLDPEGGVSAIDELSRLVLKLHALSDDDRASGTSVNVGVIEGGSRYNVVAAAAKAEVDLRVVSEVAVDRLAARIARLKPHNPEAIIRVNGGLVWPPMERTPKTDVLVRHAQETARSLGFSLDQRLAGGASDGNFCAAVGAAVLDGLGPVGGGAHAATEHVSIADMPSRAALVAGLIRRFTSIVSELERDE